VSFCVHALRVRPPDNRKPTTLHRQILLLGRSPSEPRHRHNVQPSVFASGRDGWIWHKLIARLARGVHRGLIPPRAAQRECIQRPRLVALEPRASRP
jgi:hypothetical protein